jgi:hypothetical protein
MGKFSNRRFLAAADPGKDYELIYRISATQEFSREARTGLKLAFLRTLAIPSIASTLVGSGEMLHRPVKRVDDTTIIVYGLIDHGISSDQGQQLLHHLNRIHRPFGLDNQDAMYVLATLAVIPVRWIAAHGWRNMHPHEPRAAALFWHNVGGAMHLHDVPATYPGFDRYLTLYERRHMTYSPASHQLGTATLDYFLDRLPNRARPAASALISACLDPPVNAALGYRPASRTATAVLNTALRLRALAELAAPARALPALTDASRPRASYPHGYQLSQLGPRTGRTPLSGLSPGNAPTGESTA